MSYPHYGQQPPHRLPGRVIKGNDGGMGAIIVFFLVIGFGLFGAQKVGVIDIAALAAPKAGPGSGSSAQKENEKKPDAPTDIRRKLLDEARKFDNKAYIWGGGHPPTSSKINQGVDCSGLVNVAVLRATEGRVNENRLAQTFRYSPNWKHIKMSEAGPGDILYRLIATHGGTTDHVVFVVENKGKNNVKIFEAATYAVPYNEQIRYATNSYADYTAAMRYIGPK